MAKTTTYLDNSYPEFNDKSWYPVRETEVAGWDSNIFRNREMLDMIVEGGGTVTFGVDESAYVEWDAPLYLHSPRSAAVSGGAIYKITIEAQRVTPPNGGKVSAFYVQPTVWPLAADEVLAVNVADSSNPLPADALVFALWLPGLTNRIVFSKPRQSDADLAGGGGGAGRESDLVRVGIAPQGGSYPIGGGQVPSSGWFPVLLNVLENWTNSPVIGSLIEEERFDIGLVDSAGGTIGIAADVTPYIKVGQPIGIMNSGNANDRPFYAGREDPYIVTNVVEDKGDSVVTVSPAPPVSCEGIGQVFTGVLRVNADDFVFHAVGSSGARGAGQSRVALVLVDAATYSGGAISGGSEPISAMGQVVESGTPGVDDRITEVPLSATLMVALKGAPFKRLALIQKFGSATANINARGVIEEDLIGGENPLASISIVVVPAVAKG